jgi:hypothetical protein
MKWSIAEENQYITEARFRVVDQIALLTWQWPKGIEFVYIVKSSERNNIGPEYDLPMKLYTKEEYKANAGYKDLIQSIGKVVVKIYPAIRENGEMILLNQENNMNEIEIKGQKAKIYYSITYSKGWFSKQKTVKMRIRPDIYLPKETLCYVKSEGKRPISVEEGTIYSFVHDFEPGHRNELPEIQVNKDDHIGIFFTDGKKYGEIYELIPE